MSIVNHESSHHIQGQNLGVKMLLKILEWSMFLIVVVEVLSLDVEPGDDLTLECVYDPNEYRLGQTIMRFWVRDNGTGGGADAVSMNNKVLTHGYQMNIDEYYGEYNLFISNASLQIHNGTFRCHIEDREENTKTRVKSEIPLTILNKPGPPVIYPKSPTVEQDQFIEVNCSTVGGNPWPRIQWLHENKSIVEPRDNGSFTSTEVVEKNVQDPAKNVYISTLLVKGEREDHNKHFLCAVSNSAMEVNKTIEAKMKMNVQYPARLFIRPFGHVKIEEHSNVTFSCTMDANPPIYLFFWSFKGGFLNQKTTFNIPDVKVRHEGMYECYGVNRIGDGSPKNETFMEVLHRPIHNHSSEVKVKEGSPVKINCSPTGRPPPYSTMWYKYGNSSFRQNGTELQFKSVKRGDQGFYACESRSILNLSILGTSDEKEEERTMRTNLSLIVKKADPIPSSTTPIPPPCMAGTIERSAHASLPPFAELADVVFEKKSKLLYFLVLGKVPVFIKIDVKYEGESDWELYDSYTVLTQQFSLALLPRKYRGPYYKNASSTKPIQSVRIRVCQLSGLFCGKNHHAEIYEDYEQDGDSWILYSLWIILTFIVVAVITACSFISCFFTVAYLYRRKFPRTSNPSPENPIPLHIQDENPNEDPYAIQVARPLEPNLNSNAGQGMPLSQLELGSIFRFQRPRMASVLV